MRGKIQIGILRYCNSISWFYMRNQSIILKYTLGMCRGSSPFHRTVVAATISRQVEVFAYLSLGKKSHTCATTEPASFPSSQTSGWHVYRYTTQISAPMNIPLNRKSAQNLFLSVVMLSYESMNILFHYN